MGIALIAAILVTLLVTIQLTAVPVWNKQAEFNHNTGVQQDVQNLQSRVASTAATGRGGTTNVNLGTQYPSRMFLLNPPDPTGKFSMGKDAEFSIHNAVALDGETSDYWN
ncbi:MAG: hypothetical protein SXQ77_00915, partial [Halobacteria archaeon]|nr:hypothetical protein [Halobacteria archaeon]